MLPEKVHLQTVGIYRQVTGQNDGRKTLKVEAYQQKRHFCLLFVGNVLYNLAKCHTFAAGIIKRKYGCHFNMHVTNRVKSSFVVSESTFVLR